MKKIVGLLIVLCVSWFSMRPLVSDGYFSMHDDTQVARVVVMGKALKQGQFPVRMVSDLGYGYGYPIFNFYGPLPYYIGGGLYALGVDSVVATKLMFAIGMLIAPVTMYLLVTYLFGGFAGIVASMLFLYAPYHAVQVYVRGSVGEYWAIAFVPLIIYGFVKGLRGSRTTSSVLLGAFGLAATIVSHTILGFLTSALFGISTIVVWIVEAVRRKLTKQILAVPIAIGVLGLALSAFFWLPAYVELPATGVVQMIQQADTTFFDHFVCPMQLVSSPWGFAGSAPGCIDGMSFKLGKIHIVMAILGCFGWAVWGMHSASKRRVWYMGGMILLTAVSLFLLLPISEPVWRMVPIASIVQYPWRFLAYTMLFISVCGAYAVSLVKVPWMRMGAAFVIILLTVIVNANLFVPQTTYSRPSKQFESFEELRFTKSRISDEYLPVGIIKPQSAEDVAKTAVEGNTAFLVNHMTETDTNFKAEIESDSAQTITIKKAWFPGWKVFVNGNLVPSYQRSGFISVNIPQGKSIIEMKFTDTPVRSIGNWISIIGVLLLGGIVVYGKKANT